MRSRTGKTIAFISVLVITPVSALADDIGIGKPNTPPAATDPDTTETESSWWNELLETFEFESE